MSEPWHDIGDPGFFRVKTPPEKKSQVYASDIVADSAANDDTEEVTLSAPEFIKSEEGFQFNKKCGVQVKIEYLKQAVRKKVTFALFSEYKGEVQDLHHKVDGSEENGVSKAEVTLYYNDAHYDDYVNDPTITVDYFSKPRTLPQKKSKARVLPCRLRKSKRIGRGLWACSSTRTSVSSCRKALTE